MAAQNNQNGTVLKPVPMGLFPTFGSLQEVVDYSESKLPVMTKNDLTALLMIYHNTLLKELNESSNQPLR